MIQVKFWQLKELRTAFVVMMQGISLIEVKLSSIAVLGAYWINGK